MDLSGWRSRFCRFGKGTFQLACGKSTAIWEMSRHQAVEVVRFFVDGRHLSRPQTLA